MPRAFLRRTGLAKGGSASTWVNASLMSRSVPGDGLWSTSATSSLRYRTRLKRHCSRICGYLTTYRLVAQYPFSGGLLGGPPAQSLQQLLKFLQCHLSRLCTAALIPSAMFLSLLLRGAKLGFEPQLPPYTAALISGPRREVERSPLSGPRRGTVWFPPERPEVVQGS